LIPGGISLDFKALWEENSIFIFIESVQSKSLYYIDKIGLKILLKEKLSNTDTVLKI
jgi:hypothetical protein